MVAKRGSGPRRVGRYGKATRSGPVPTTIEADAVYEDGVLKPERPLALKEGTRVHLRIETKPEEPTPTSDVISPRVEPRNCCLPPTSASDELLHLFWSEIA